MSDTVWTIESGEYSDYRVWAVYSTKKQATDVLDACGVEWADGPEGGYNTRVVERPLNPKTELTQLQYDLWSVRMSRDGTVDRLEKRPVDVEDIYGSDLGVWFEREIIGNVVARSSKHAVKIANEFRAQAIADGRLE